MRVFKVAWAEWIIERMELHIKGIWLKWQKRSKRREQKEVKITSRNLNKTKTECHDSCFYITIIKYVSLLGHSLTRYINHMLKYVL